MNESLPMSAGKLANYNSRRGADAYRRDHQTKLHRKVSDRRERQILTRFFDLLGPCDSVLDLPCGAGRFYAMLQDRARHIVEADWSRTMLDLNAEEHGHAALAYLRCSALEIPLGDDAVDVAVSIRLSHHLDRPEDRERHLRELCRVARRGVIATWFSAHSLKNLIRKARAPFNTKRAKNTMANSDVARIASACGFPRFRAVPLSRLGSGHAYGLLRTNA